MCSSKERQVLVSLGMTKGGKRQGAAESVILGVERAVFLVRRWKQLSSPSTPLVPSAIRWRSLFSEALEQLGLASYGFRPYSLRRGGATWWFSKHQSLDRLLVQGRWAAQRTARIYVNEGLASILKIQKSNLFYKFTTIWLRNTTLLHLSLHPLGLEELGGLERRTNPNVRGASASKKAPILTVT